jgi:hypothetical protein
MNDGPESGLIGVTINLIIYYLIINARIILNVGQVNQNLRRGNRE